MKLNDLMMIYDEEKDTLTTNCIPTRKIEFPKDIISTPTRNLQNQLIEILYQIRNASKYIKKDILLQMRKPNSYDVETTFEESYFKFIDNILTVEVYDEGECVSRTEIKLPKKISQQ
jgi:hypothetical protein